MDYKALEEIVDSCIRYRELTLNEQFEDTMQNMFNLDSNDVDRFPEEKLDAELVRLQDFIYNQVEHLCASDGLQDKIIASIYTIVDKSEIEKNVKCRLLIRIYLSILSLVEKYFTDASVRAMLTLLYENQNNRNYIDDEEIDYLNKLQKFHYSDDVSSNLSRLLNKLSTNYGEWNIEKEKESYGVRDKYADQIEMVYNLRYSLGPKNEPSLDSMVESLTHILAREEIKSLYHRLVNASSIEDRNLAILKSVL